MDNKTPIKGLIEELTKKRDKKINKSYVILDKTINGNNLKQLFNDYLKKEQDFIYEIVNKFSDTEIPKEAIIEELNNYKKYEK